jgi:hypothetical protein
VERNFSEENKFLNLIYFALEQEGEYTNYNLMMLLAAWQSELKGNKGLDDQPERDRGMRN